MSKKYETKRLVKKSKALNLYFLPDKKNINALVTNQLIEVEIQEMICTLYGKNH